MSDRLEEIEARAKAARHDEWRWDSLLEAGELGDAGRMHISVPGRPRDPPSIFALLAHKDVVWLVAQVRERDAEIARLKAELADANRAGVEVGKAQGLEAAAKAAWASHVGCAHVKCWSCTNKSAEAAVRALLEETPDA